MKTTANNVIKVRKNVVELVNELIDSCNGKHVSDTKLAYRIAGLCRTLETITNGITNGIPEKAWDATDLFLQSFNYAVQNSLVTSLGWWQIIAGGILAYYSEIGEFDAEDVKELREFIDEVSDDYLCMLGVSCRK